MASDVEMFDAPSQHRQQHHLPLSSLSSSSSPLAPTTLAQIPQPLSTTMSGQAQQPTPLRRSSLAAVLDNSNNPLSPLPLPPRSNHNNINNNSHNTNSSGSSTNTDYTNINNPSSSTHNTYHPQHHINSASTSASPASPTSPAPAPAPVTHTRLRSSPRSPHSSSHLITPLSPPPRPISIPVRILTDNDDDRHPPNSAGSSTKQQQFPSQSHSLSLAPPTSQRRGTSDSPVSVYSSPIPSGSPVSPTNPSPPPTTSPSPTSLATPKAGSGAKKRGGNASSGSKPPSSSATSRKNKSASGSDTVGNGTAAAAAEVEPTSTNLGASASTTAISTSTKPKSSRPAKARSPSPSPPPQPLLPPIQTIRLEIRLGGPDNYEVDIASRSRETGQRPSTPVRTKPPVVSSESEDEGGDEEDEKKKKKKKKKKNVTSEYYDITDPFIDDSELAIDERTWFAQTKQQGFYVSSGEVALLKDKAPKKPKSKKQPGASAALGGTSKASTAAKTKQESGGKKDSSTAAGDDHKEPMSISAFVKNPKGVDDDGGGDSGDGGGSAGGAKAEDGEHEGDTGQKRKRYITIMEGGKKRKIVDVNSFHPEIQAEIENLKEAITKENWSQKGKFPPGIKPLLNKLALLAIKLDEYDDHFFSLMPTLFPYNKFTMSKLIKRTVFTDHVQFLVSRQEALLQELAEQARTGFAKAEEEWEKSVQAWDKRQEKARLEAATGDAGDSASGSAAPTRHPTEEMDVDGEEGKVKEDRDGAGGASAAGGLGGGGKDSHPPAKKYRMTESMKAIVWQLVMLSNECCRLENEKNALEGSMMQVSEQGSRKVLYQKIVAAFPEGWMSSGQISRDVSAMKKKLEKEAMENEG